MPHLLHVDSSVQGDRSVSRRLSARAVAAWRAAHPDGLVTYRDLAADPVPHLGAAGVAARYVPADEHTATQAAAWAHAVRVVEEVREADVVVLGMPLYNFGPPSHLKAWIDHLVTPGLAFDPQTAEPWLGGRDLVVVASRGGGYGEGTPREGWDHAGPWLPHALSMTGLQPRFVTAELTLAPVTPAMADLVPLAEQSLADAERAVDRLRAPAPAAVAVSGG